MGKEVEAYNDMVVPRAAGKGDTFLRVIQSTCRDEGLDLNLQPAKKSLRDKTIVLRAPIHAGRGNALELEVFADSQGNSLHVGWEASRPVVGGALAGVGMFGEMNAMSRRGAARGNNQRQLSGVLQAFDSLVFMPVVQMLNDAVKQERGPRQNGFLGTQ